MASIRRPIPTIAQARHMLEHGHELNAKEMAEAILKIQPRSVDAMVLIALVARKRHDYVEVDRLATAALKIKPRDRFLCMLQARNLFHMGQSAPTIEACIRALELFPDDADFLMLKALAHETRFEREQVLTSIGSLMRVPQPRADVCTLAGRALLGLDRFSEAIEWLLKAANNPHYSMKDRRELWFVLSKTYDRAGDYEQAMHACAQAHLLQTKEANPQTFTTLVEDLMGTYSAATVRSLSRSASRSDLPVFVVGMPRSGTTLVEQIIHAHPMAFGAGELSDMKQIARLLPTETGSIHPYPAAATDMTVETATTLGQRYLARLAHMASAASRVVNKMPHDYLHVGLIWQLLPGARIIHTLRDPLDTCLSCYMRPLILEAIPYAASLEDLGRAYRQHERLMDHWKATLDLPILTVRYEELVADQERITRQIIDFLGLPWDDRCLRYWETDRTVMTLSYDQVNRPIYDSSIGRWRNYEKHLQPLIKSLGMQP